MWPRSPRADWTFDERGHGWRGCPDAVNRQGPTGGVAGYRADGVTDDETVRTAAVAIAQHLEAALADVGARTVVLTRDEALLTLRMVRGVAEITEREGTS